MSGILDGLSAALQGAVDFTFSDCVLKAATGAKVSNGSGGWTQASSDNACRAKLDKKQAADGKGGIVIITRVIILRGSLSVTPQAGNVITGLDATYRLTKVDTDGLGSHWMCEVESG